MICIAIDSVVPGNFALGMRLFFLEPFTHFGELVDDSRPLRL
jgi:hypothetical protein